MDEIVAQSFVFFFAGFETSSTTMTFALFELSINPEIQENVRSEVLTVLEQYDNKLCYESLKKLDYMQQVIDGNFSDEILPNEIEQIVISYASEVLSKHFF